MQKLTLFIVILLSTLSIFGQNWQPIDFESIPIRGERNINPDLQITAFVDDGILKDMLWDAPQELEFDTNNGKPLLLNVMMADGTIDEFNVVQYQMMESALAAKYSEIRTFHGVSTSNAVRKIRINYTVHGFRAVITDEKGQTYIDHLQRNDRDHKIIYRRNDLQTTESWACDYKEEKLNDRATKASTGGRSGDCLFRSYRFAITATGEYSNYHGAFSIVDSALVMSAIVTTVDRVNDVFEQDLTMRLILIDDVDDLFYYDPGTDPFSGSNAGSMISQNQTVTDQVIGSANYDLGHIVSTGGSGLASLGVVCANGFKARGVTGISVPEGDPFDIDYVAHEIGHQLGANHTQNNNCNRNGSTAMEPGSASTIMGYAGICNPNVQNNSDAYFHAISIQEMNAELTGNSCHGVIALSNVAPVVASLTDKSIPHSTPFVLDAIATDADGDVLTYNWEQMDNEVGSMPPQGTNTQGPMFRSLFATTDSMRYFPNINSIINGTSVTWEVLPTVDRNMDFRVTVRDNSIAPGCTDEQDITLDVEGNAGPFLVTSQNTPTTWLESESVTISWDVANTDITPVSCANVDILISYDGGLTYPTTMIEATPNDGSATVNVPLGTTSTARIMVKCSDNVFFNINNTDIVIDPGSPSFSIATNPSSGSVCDDLSISFNLESTSILGFNQPITLSISDLPNGASSSITTNPLTPGNNTQITIDDLDGQIGNFNIKITGVANGITKEAFFNITVENDLVAPGLSAPTDQSSGIEIQPTLFWNSTPGASSYEYEVSTLPDGANVVAAGSTSNTSIFIASELNISTTYYWRVRSINSCGVTPWSVEWEFETANCITKAANDLPISISPNGTPTITSTFNLLDRGIISDLNIINLAGTHTWMEDLNFTLTSPDGSSNSFWSDPCGSQDDFNINFDDEATGNYPCPPTDGLSYLPDNPLSIFDTKEIQGEWQLTVFDDFNQDGGSLNAWGVEICLDSYCDLTVDDNAFVDSYGTLLSALNCAVDGDTIYLENSISGMTIDAELQSIIIDQNIVIKAETNSNITISSNGNQPSFIINTGKTVSFIGFSIESLTSTNGVIQNNGSLLLRDMNVQAGLGNASVQNLDSGNLTVEGTCNLSED